MWGQLFAAAIPAVGRLVGGLLNKDDEPRTTTTTTDYSALVRSAEAAGFNPLTVLRAGGGAGFTTTQHPTFGSRDFIADAFSAGVDGFMSYDPNALERDRIELDLMREQLTEIQDRNTNPGFLDVPVRDGPEAEQTGPWLGEPVDPVQGRVTATNPNMYLHVNPGVPDSQMCEDRYHEIGGFTCAVRNYAQDFTYSLRQFARNLGENRRRREGRDFEYNRSQSPQIPGWN